LMIDNLSGVAPGEVGLMTCRCRQLLIINKKATLIYFEGWPVGSQKQF